MTRGKIDKKIPALEPFFESVLVCNDKNLRPFIEIFVHEPENVAQQRLGTLLGIFEVDDDSEDSSYIVNYLISVIKKEYFSKPKNGPIESFEAALHKANLALSKLAEHENIQWIGKLNSLVAVIEKNSLHLSQAGTASAFLLRSSALTDISEGLSEYGTEPHPLKTFTNVSSGKLEVDDKLIIATENIFDIFSFEEIKKSALRFSDEQFVQFLKTALSNELQKAATLVVDIKEKQEAPAPVARKEEAINAFSQSAFYKNIPARKTAEPGIQEPQLATDGDKREKTGHLYIKESEETVRPRENFDFSNYSAGAREKTRSAFSSLLAWFISFFKKIKGLAVSGFWSIGAWIKSKKQKREIMLNEAKKEALPAINEPTAKERFSIQQFYAQPGQAETKGKLSETLLAKLKTGWKKSISALFNWLPKFSRIKNSFSGLNYQQKLSALLVILAIVIVPLFIVMALKHSEPTKVEPVVEAPVQVVLPLEQDKNVARIDTLNEVYSGNNIIRVIELNNKLFAAADNQIINLENQETYAIPDDFGKIDLACPMDDLNLIFAINKAGRKIISWSPISKKFQPNNIVIPETANIVAVETYLTYLYLVDSQNSQIYRYPRAEGGFGAKIDWKKDTTNIAVTTDIAINENLFAADSQNILKFYQGKKQDFSIEETDTIIRPDKLYTQRNNTNLYVMDKTNARIIKLDQDGKIIAQFYHPEIGEAISFTINEATNSIYFTSPEKTESFQIN